MAGSVTLRSKLGCWLGERWRAEAVMHGPGLAAKFGLEWLDLSNRSERLLRDERSGGRVCLWKDSSKLTLNTVFPAAGSRLLSHCLKRWPVELSGTRVSGRCHRDSHPHVSFLIGVRGRNRLGQFWASVASMLGQVDCVSEVVVVEQSTQCEYRDLVPEGVRYVFDKASEHQAGFNRARALNQAASIARGDILVLLDADMIVPSRLASAVKDLFDGELEAARLPRFIFYLGRESSERVQQELELTKPVTLDSIEQNHRNPLAIRRNSFFEIGGFDESFVGWGGEDVEFIDRLCLLDFAQGGFLPILHLWHPMAAQRASGHRNRLLLNEKLTIDREARVCSLREARSQPMSSCRVVAR